MRYFEYSSLINAPVDVVWQFHTQPDTLQQLTPPWQPVEIVRREGGLEIGAISEFKIYLGLIAIRWLARHTECIENQIFTDEQVDGPMEFWKHRHQFAQINGKTRLTDTIEYKLPGGEIAELLLGWWVNSRLEDMFRYRHQVTRQACEKRTTSV